jgi:hypothetical protein
MCTRVGRGYRGIRAYPFEQVLEQIVTPTLKSVSLARW